MKSAVAYTRVSTDKQGRSGLGLEAQMAALVRFAEAEGYDLAETFAEVETGKGADALDRRPQLSAALTAARKLKAPIIVAKLDRLSRDVHFISGLMTHRTPFIVAELGRGRRSVHAAPLRRAGGERAPSDQPADQGRARGQEGAGRQARRPQRQRHPNREEARARAEALRPVLAELAGQSARAIAAELTARGIATPCGGRWHAETVLRVQRRLKSQQ